MAVDVFLKGLLIGLAASIPLGPIGVLCIQRTLNKGVYSGFFSGLGAAVADTFMAMIAALGVTFIINFIEQQMLFFHIIGGLVVAFLGIRIFYTNPAKQMRQQRRKKSGKLVKDFVSVLLLTLSNPVAVFLFIAFFASFNVLQDESPAFASVILIVGTFSGAALWWFTLSNVVNKFRSKFRLRRLLIINRISGSVIFAFGIFVILTIL